MTQGEHHGLPVGVRRPEPVTAWQPSLFKRPFRSALADLHVSLDDVARWHAHGWLSFDETEIAEVDEFDDPRIWELTVVRDIARSGLNDAQVDHLLGQLARPCAVDPDRLAYSFRHGWIEICQPREPDVDAIVEENLNEWLDSCDEERLRKLKEDIDSLLARRKKDSAEQEE